MSDKVFLNDSLVDADKAAVSVSDAGLLYAIGLFETIRIYHSRPFRLGEHIERMLESADQLDLPLRHSGEQIAEAAIAVIEANGVTDGRMRITVTRGPTTAPKIAKKEDAPPQPRSTLIVTAAADAGYPQAFYENGMAVAVAAARVNPADLTAMHKTLSYWPRLMTLEGARGRQCGEALWFTIDNRLAEGCVSNVFLVAAGKVLTPELDTPVLPGVTRAAVLELCKDNSIPAEEKAITREDLASADELFLTNSIMEVMPVVLADRRTIGDGKPGPVTRQIAELYRELIETETATDDTDDTDEE